MTPRHYARRIIGSWYAAAAVFVASAQAEQRPHTVNVKAAGETLSITARGAPLDEVIAAIARETGLIVEGAPLSPDPVTAQIEGASLAEAVASMLADRSYLLTYVPPLGSARSRLWLLPKATDSAAIGTARQASGTPNANATTETSRLEAVAALATSRDWATSTALATSHSDPTVRAEAARVLAAIGGDAAVDGLASVLADAAREVRRAAIEGLAAIGSERAVAALGGALASADREVRAATVDSLAAIGSPAAVARLQQALGDPDLEVRAAAAGYVETLTAGDPGRPVPRQKPRVREQRQ